MKPTIERRDKIVLLGKGRWFASSKAQCWEEDTYWDGRNHISKATGSQWNHEALWKTAKGVWVLQSWSQWEGSRETWEIVTQKRAHQWLIDQGEVNAVPDQVWAEGEV